VTIVDGARCLRCLAYGALSVIFGITLADRGFTPTLVGAVMSLALLSGAASSAFSGAVVKRIGFRATLLTGAALMVLSPLAFGALVGGLVTRNVVLAGYACCGGALLVLYAQLPSVASPIRVSKKRPRASSDNVIVQLTALFGLDAFAGGFIVQGFLAYWLHLRFGTSAAAIGVVLFLANVLAAGSFLVADRVAAKIGLVRTMVYTHLPSNIVLCIVPLMPTFESASAALLLRFAFSQMDVPTRQAFTMSRVAPQNRAYAAGVTSAVRPAAAAFGPVLAGVALQHAGSGLPFFLGGGLKIVYDLLCVRAIQRTFKPRRLSSARRYPVGVGAC